MGQRDCYLCLGGKYTCKEKEKKYILLSWGNEKGGAWMLCSKLTVSFDSVDLLRRSRFGAIFGRSMIGVIAEGPDCGSSLEGQSLGLVLKGEGMNHYLQVFFFFWPVRVKNIWTRQVRRERRKAEVGGDSGEARGWDRPVLTNVSSLPLRTVFLTQA